MSSGLFVNVGKIEEVARQQQRNPTYYAADWEILDIIPGLYDLYVEFVGGYLVPMPYWLHRRIDAIRVDGMLYSGFGGKIFSSTPLPKGEKVSLCVTTYASSEINALFPQDVYDRIQWREGFSLDFFSFKKNNITEWDQLIKQYGATQKIAA
jgi:hypothetical protein